MPSRQYEHQKRKRAAGICITCTLPSVDGWRCAAHAADNAIRRRERYRKLHPGCRKNKRPVYP
jgi:hypothetical protein